MFCCMVRFEWFKNFVKIGSKFLFFLFFFNLMWIRVILNVVFNVMNGDLLDSFFWRKSRKVFFLLLFKDLMVLLVLFYVWWVCLFVFVGELLIRFVSNDLNVCFWLVVLFEFVVVDEVCDLLLFEDFGLLLLYLMIFKIM